MVQAVVPGILIPHRNITIYAIRCYRQLRCIDCAVVLVEEGIIGVFRPKRPWEICGMTHARYRGGECEIKCKKMGKQGKKFLTDNVEISTMFFTTNLLICVCRPERFPATGGVGKNDI